MNHSATEFLSSVRSLYRQLRFILPDHLTFLVSPEVFQEYVEETESLARVLPDNKLTRTKYLLTNIRVKEDKSLTGLGVRIVEGKHEWETF